MPDNQLVEARQAVNQCLADLGQFQTDVIFLFAECNANTEFDDARFIASIRGGVDSFGERIANTERLLTDDVIQAIEAGNLGHGIHDLVSVNIRSILYAQVKNVDGDGSQERMIVETYQAKYQNWHLAAIGFVRTSIDKVESILRTSPISIVISDFVRNTYVVPELVELANWVSKESSRARLNRMQSLSETKAPTTEMKLSHARMLRLEKPELSDRKIAKLAGLNSGQLTRDEIYQRLKQATSGDVSEKPRGFKNASTGDIEGWNE